MSRLKTYTRSLISMYALMGANAVYTLVSIPLALRYLSAAEFGLWALVNQIAGYIAMVDLGMNSSVSRILIDHKDERANGRYGGVIKSSVWAGLAQGAIALVAGLGLSFFFGGWLKVDLDLRSQFFWLMAGQVLLTAATFASRIFSQILFAWQRLDIGNYNQILQLAVGFAALWLGFFFGLGVFSLLAGAAAMWISGLAANALACLRLGLFPKPGEWGRTSKGHFRELFSYGADVFLIAFGTQLILSSQTVLVSRQLGLESAALWSVLTKPFTVVSQIIFRVVGNAMPAFAEMHVRKETERMWRRYHALFVTVSVFAGVCAMLLVACNGPFIRLWTHDEFSWPEVNNVILACWLVVMAQQCCHNSLIMTLKEIRGLKYAYLAEGLVFVGVSAVLLPRTGLIGMLICSLAATLLVTWLVGSLRVAGLQGDRPKLVFWAWQRPVFGVLIVTVPCWLVAKWLLRDAHDWVRLVVNAVLLTGAGGWAAIRFALPQDLMTEVAGKLPGPLRRIIVSILSLIGHRNYGIV